VKKFVLPIGAGVVVFGVVTAFAASLTVNSKSLAAGNATAGACNSSAAVTYATALATSGANKGKYVVSSASVTTDGLPTSACGGMAYRVSLLDASNVAVGAEGTGTLAADGTGTVTFASGTVLAHDVEGVAVVITG
jgi:hypothetical protein